MTNEKVFKRLVKESVGEIWEEKSGPKKNKLIDVLGVILTPVVIASVSLLVTYEINKSQAMNARRIADAQIESAQRMADAQRDHNARIAEAELEVERLKHIDKTFQQIIKHENLLSFGKSQFPG